MLGRVFYEITEFYETDGQDRYEICIPTSEPLNRVNRIENSTRTLNHVSRAYPSMSSQTDCSGTMIDSTTAMILKTPESDDDHIVTLKTFDPLTATVSSEGQIEADDFSYPRIGLHSRFLSLSKENGYEFVCLADNYKASFENLANQYRLEFTFGPWALFGKYGMQENAIDQVDHSAFKWFELWDVSVQSPNLVWNVPVPSSYDTESLCSFESNGSELVALEEGYDGYLLHSFSISDGSLICSSKINDLSLGEVDTILRQREAIETFAVTRFNVLLSRRKQSTNPDRSYNQVISVFDLKSLDVMYHLDMTRDNLYPDLPITFSIGADQVSFIAFTAENGYVVLDPPVRVGGDAGLVHRKVEFGDDEDTVGVWIAYKDRWEGEEESGIAFVRC